MPSGEKGGRPSALRAGWWGGVSSGARLRERLSPARSRRILPQGLGTAATHPGSNRGVCPGTGPYTVPEVGAASSPQGGREEAAGLGGCAHLPRPGGVKGEGPRVLGVWCPGPEAGRRGPPAAHGAPGPVGASPPASPRSPRLGAPSPVKFCEVPSGRQAPLHPTARALCLHPPHPRCAAKTVGFSLLTPAPLCPSVLSL